MKFTLSYTPIVFVLLSLDADARLGSFEGSDQYSTNPFAPLFDYDAGRDPNGNWIAAPGSGKGPQSPWQFDGDPADSPSLSDLNSIYIVNSTGAGVPFHGSQFFDSHGVNKDIMLHYTFDEADYGGTSYTPQAQTSGLVNFSYRVCPTNEAGGSADGEIYISLGFGDAGAWNQLGGFTLGFEELDGSLDFSSYINLYTSTGWQRISYNTDTGTADLQSSATTWDRVYGTIDLDNQTVTATYRQEFLGIDVPIATNQALSTLGGTISSLDEFKMSYHQTTTGAQMNGKFYLDDFVMTIPEPSSALLSAASLLLLLRRRRA